MAQFLKASFGKHNSKEIVLRFTSDIQVLVKMLRHTAVHVPDRTLKNRIIRVIKKLEKTDQEGLSSTEDEETY